MTTLNRTFGECTEDAGIVEAEGAREELVAPGLVRDVRLMVDGRRITFYRRVRR